MKNYQKPEAEVIAIVTAENIAAGDIPGGDMGLASNIFGN